MNDLCPERTCSCSAVFRFRARPLLIHLYQTRALENRVFIARVDFASPRCNGASAIFDFEGTTQDELGSDECVLVSDLNLTKLRNIRGAWNPVYGPPYRYPPAYKRIALLAPGETKSCIDN